MTTHKERKRVGHAGVFSPFCAASPAFSVPQNRTALIMTGRSACPSVGPRGAVTSLRPTRRRRPSDNDVLAGRCTCLRAC